MANSKATQEFIPIKEIRDGVVVLRDNSLRIVLMVSSINFALKSEDLQEATISQFQNLLNALDFSVEIYIQSRRMDIRPYLALLEERQNGQMNDLLKVQIREYIKFIREFTDGSNIMSKRFFTVIPYAATLLSPGGGNIKEKIANAIPIGKSEEEKSPGTEESFLDNKIQLEQRVSVVEQGLLRCGLRSVRLGTEELVEFYYRLFNPGETSKPAGLTKV